MRYECQINLRISKKEKEELKKILDQKEITLGEFLREQIKSFLKKEQKNNGKI